MLQLHTEVLIYSHFTTYKTISKLDSAHRADLLPVCSEDTVSIQIYHCSLKNISLKCPLLFFFRVENLLHLYSLIYLFIIILAIFRINVSLFFFKMFKTVKMTAYYQSPLFTHMLASSSGGAADRSAVICFCKCAHFSTTKF